MRKLLMSLIVACLVGSGCLPGPGSKVIIEEQCTGAISEADYKEMWSKSSDTDLAGLQDMRSAGKLVVIPAETEGMVIEKTSNLLYVEVNIRGQVQKLWISGEDIQ
jgi:hypothetical protein